MPSEYEKMGTRKNSVFGHFSHSVVNGKLLNLVFIESIKLNCGDIISFSNKLKFDQYNIFTNLFILEKKIINTCPSDTLISLKS